MALSVATKTGIAGVGLALAATLAWSGNFIAIKGFAAYMPPSAQVFWRFLTACLIMLPISYKALREYWPQIKPKLKWLALYGLIGMCISNLCVYRAPKTIPAVNMVILSAISPLFMMLIARFIFCEPITRNRMFGGMVALFGVVTLVTQGNFAYLAEFEFKSGNLWSLAGAFCFSFYSVTLRLSKTNMPLRVFLFMVFLFGLLWAIPFYFWETKDSFVSPLQPNLLLGLLYMGLIASCLAFYCWNAAVNRIGAVRAGIIYYFLPVFGAVEAMIFLGEDITTPQLVGGVLILGGVIFSSLPGKTITEFRKMACLAKNL